MRPFHLGAFVVAARAGVPIVPVALRGARELLPDGTWWPRRSVLEVEVCDPLEPATDADDELDASQRLRTASLRAIARRADAT
jgi:1-acyl-sn-glycerol-3-phosphate acyltransferase